MRHSDKRSKLLVILALITPLVLIVPNVILDFTEINISVMGKILNVFFPLSCYLLIVSVFRKTGWGVLCCFPFMLFAAFEIVILYLYGESIIAVDMFLNVVTTDFKEASTLLGNLTPAILLVILLYLPPLLWAGYSLYRGYVMNHYYRMLMLTSSLTGVIVFGLWLFIVALIGNVTPWRDTFPVNVISNVGTAVSRVRLASQYPASAQGFTYNATSTDSTRRAIVLVIGETARPDRWEIFGSDRPTNPCLSQREGLHLFERALTQSNTTHKSVPMLLSPVTAETFNTLNGYKSLITAFKEAGFHTTWMANQPPNGAYNQHMGEEADTTLFYKYVSDVDLVGHVADLLDNADVSGNRLIVLHTYGSHFPYDDRYKGTTPVFTPDEPMIAKSSNREALLNAYDNTVVATDMALDSMISVISRYYDDAVVIYASDHGEDIFDDKREKFLHASPAPTVYQLRVPMLIWTSNEFERRRKVGENADKNRYVPLQPSVAVFHTVLDAGNIATPYLDKSLSVLSDSFTPGRLMYLTDLNEAVPMENSGLRQPDFEVLKALGITFPKK